MSARGTKCVTNHRGEMFTGNGVDTYDGLVVVDGTLIPQTLGVSPLVTIAGILMLIYGFYLLAWG